MPEERLSMTRELWDQEAAGFDQEPDHGLLDPATRQAWLDLLRGVLPPAPGRIADLGCGTGTLAVLLAEQGYAVNGLDFSPEMIARARAKGAGLDISFVEGDANAPALTAASYDVVLSRHVLWAMDDPADALAHWIALLKPGGLLVLVEGRWHTGSGISAEDCERFVCATGRDATVRPMPEPIFWGSEITDERYLLVSRTQGIDSAPVSHERGPGPKL